MNDTLQARNRKDATIPVAICLVCFCSVPDTTEQVDAHAQWHRTRDGAS